MPLVVFLHGWGVDSSVLSGVREVVAEKYPTMTFDFPGFGSTPEPPAPWEVSDYVHWTVDRINAAVDSAQQKCAATADGSNTGERQKRAVILFGHSFGARIIFKMLGDSKFVDTLQFDVEKIIITGGAGVHGAKDQKKYVSFADVVYKLAKKTLPPDKMRKLAYKRGSADYKVAYDQSQVMGQTFTRVVSEDLTPYLQHVTPETLLIWGDIDDATPLEHAEIMELMMPNAGLAVIKNAGHYAFLEQPSTFYAIMKSYLQID